MTRECHATKRPLPNRQASRYSGDVHSGSLIDGKDSIMGLFDGKHGLILGVANDRSIAWAIAQQIMEQGGVCGFSHLPDKPDDERKKNRRRVESLTEKYPNNARFLTPLDVQRDEDIATLMAKAKEEFGHIDFL